MPVKEGRIRKEEGGPKPRLHVSTFSVNSELHLIHRLPPLLCSLPSLPSLLWISLSVHTRGLLTSPAHFPHPLLHWLPLDPRAAGRSSPFTVEAADSGEGGCALSSPAPSLLGLMLMLRSQIPSHRRPCASLGSSSLALPLPSSPASLPLRLLPHFLPI